MERIPATVLTGCLGAGKTTLLNRLLEAEDSHRYAVIVNEIGSIGIDGDLVRRADEELLEMNNGCVCCTVRGDLIRTIRRLLGSEREFDGLLIETTGLAMPAPVAQSFFVDPAIRSAVRLDSITAVVDALNIDWQLEHRPEAAEQIAFADQLIVSKTDRVGVEDVNRVLATLSRRNTVARLLLMQDLLDDPGRILGRGGFDLERIGEDLESLRVDGIFHDHEIMTVALESDKAMDAERVSAWLQRLVLERGGDILRAKGFVRVADDQRPLVFQSVHMLLEGDFAPEWPGGRDPMTRLVLIGRNLDQDALVRELEDCVG